MDLTSFLVIIKLIAWFSSTLLVLSFVPQIWRIHVHKEVRDLSPLSFWGLAIGSAGLALEAFFVGSAPLVFKQIATLVCAIVILWQIRTHREDKWKE